ARASVAHAPGSLARGRPEATGPRRRHGSWRGVRPGLSRRRALGLRVVQRLWRRVPYRSRGVRARSGHDRLTAPLAQRAVRCRVCVRLADGGAPPAPPGVLAVPDALDRARGRGLVLPDGLRTAEAWLRAAQGLAPRRPRGAPRV